MNQMNNRKLPKDIRIIVWILAVLAVIYFVLAALFLSGTSKFVSEGARPALFGLLSLVSETSSGMYFLVLGVAGLISVYGLKKGFKFGWWLVLVLSINSILDGLPLLKNHTVGVLITTSIRILLIFWLFYRRRFYGIGIAQSFS
jgi:hypothetical protein